jgi:hypothetical protein
VTEVAVAADDPESGTETGRAEETDQLWSRLRIDPVEIALPGGVGYTLRAYRPAAEFAAAAPSDGDEPDLDDFDAAAAAVLRRRRAESADVEADEEPAHPGRRGAAGAADDDSDDSDDSDDEDAEDEDAEDEEFEDELDEDETDEDEETDEDVAAAEEDVPVFLARRGRLYLFHSPEKLVEFVKAGGEHDLSELDTWPDLVERVSTEDIVALEEDTYELDLVVENLRGGPDAWDPPLILKSGELARDLGHALKMTTVIAALAPGSPLDDLDEALRTAEAGGVSGFFARRRLRRVPAQQSSLAWRTVIGKISAAADWRD